MASEIKHNLHLGNFILPLFFALSGFLVAGSLERSKSLVTFAGLRIIRLVPALAVEVIVSALILGPLLTSVPLREYFTDGRFFTYFLNLAGDIHYNLPGVFSQNPIPFTVNGQLWTIPYELICYVTLGSLAALGIFKRKIILLLAFLAMQVLLVATTIRSAQDHTVYVDGNLLVVCFIAGITLFRFRQIVPWSWPLFILSVAIALGLRWFPALQALEALPVAYVIAYLGLLNPKRVPLVFSGDYSYGIYLYGWPLQQTVASLGPAYQSWAVSLGVALPVAAAVAVFSWWYVEKPALRT